MSTGRTQFFFKSSLHSRYPQKRHRDTADSLLSWFGTGLIISFFMPIVISGGGVWKIYFLNIHLLFYPGVDFMLRVQLLYPLMAGIVLKVFASMQRSPQRSVGILITGIFPFMVLLFSLGVQEMFAEVGQYIPGGTALPFRAVLSLLGIIAMLGGAHAVRIQPGNDIAARITSIGGIFYFFALLLTLQGRFALLSPFYTMKQEDPSGLGLNLVNGVAEIIILLFMMAAAAISIKLFKQPDPKLRELKGNSIITLWALHLFVYGGVFIYIIIATVFKSVSWGGVFMLMATTFFIKMVPWILGLFIMIPLGVGEILLTVAGDVFRRRKSY